MTDVRLDVWQVRPRDIARAAAAGRRTVARLRRADAVTFAKLLGTAGPAFTPWDATPTRWALLACSAADPTDAVVRWWDEHAVEHARLALRPLWSRGTWDGIAPFGTGDRSRWDGPVLALTRSTLRIGQLSAFYRAVRPIAHEIRRARGCRVAFGIGEAPLLRQGTVSIWDSPSDVTAFAHGAAAHADAVTRTPTQGWYAEELFARFAIVGASGSIGGVAVA
jgi:hypothetical protein